MRVLIVEDNLRIGELVSAALRALGHSIELARTCAEAAPALRESVDVAIVDVGLPDGSGIDLCRAARARGIDVPILLLTARNGVEDRVAGLDAGADDYLGKPFATSELAARVRALGRRGPRLAEQVRAYGILVLDRERRTLEVAGTRVPLTPRELDIAMTLAFRDGHVVSRDDLVESVWGEPLDTANGASLDVLVARIRRKLAAAGVEDAIRTVRTSGYAWALDRSPRS